MRRLGAEQKVGVEPDGRRRRTRAVQSDGNSGARPGREVRVHPERDRDVLVAREVHGAHGNRLQRFFRHVAQHGRRVETDLGAPRRRAGVRTGISVVAEHLVEWRLDIGVAESLDDHSVDDRKRTVDWLRALHSHDRSDSDRRIERGPEMEFVRGVGFSLCGDYAA